ncbi:type II toxin-antitoxin system VapC family toxin [Microbacterium sp.]|uniref:type II toxin-antitoxin system VapC family toxin n=1 Tax=Microbacterium sp. TaxID=51671 RepID=UPI0026039299|nr:type II toxin-antitoxin system VapC family toxin [Microbacterium sp.]
MIVDTSALVAVMLAEPEAQRFRRVLEQESTAISAATVVESEIVVRSRKGAAGLNELRQALQTTEIVAVDEHQALIASDAYERYGRGSGSPAKLNYGDCFSYALAIARDEPLLFKGDDFIHTDVRVGA